MESIEAMRVRLLADTTVSNLLNDRIYYRYTPAGVDFPTVNLTPISTSAMATLSGEASNVNRDRIQVDIWAETLAEVTPAAAAVSASLLSASTFKAVHLETNHGADDNNGLVRVQIDFAVWI